MSVHKYNENRLEQAQLFERLGALPKNFFDELKDEYCNRRHVSTWGRISRGKMHFNLDDLVWLSEKIGCTINDLLNPTLDLFQKYQEALDISSAKEFGLVPPKNSHVA